MAGDRHSAVIRRCLRMRYPDAVLRMERERGQDLLKEER